MTDAPPRMTVSFNGSGDFRAALTGVEHGIELLILVRVYGEVAPGRADETPLVEAD